MLPSQTVGPLKQTSKIHPNSQTDLTRPHRAGWYQKRIDECLPRRRRRGGTKGAEVDEFAAETEDGLVQDVIEFDRRTQAHSFADLKFARNVQIKKELARPNCRIPRQVPYLTNRGKHKLTKDRGI